MSWQIGGKVLTGRVVASGSSNCTTVSISDISIVIASAWNICEGRRRDSILSAAMTACHRRNFTCCCQLVVKFPAQTRPCGTQHIVSLAQEFPKSSSCTSISCIKSVWLWQFKFTDFSPHPECRGLHRDPLSFRENRSPCGISKID